MFDARKVNVRNGIVAFVKFAGAHLETASWANSDAIYDVGKRNLYGIEVGKGTACDRDVMQIAFSVFGIKIIGLEVFGRPR